MRINWLNLTTVGSAAIMVGTMIFGLAYATGWALGGLLGLGDLGAYFFETAFAIVAAIGLIAFVRSANTADPILGPVVRAEDADIESKPALDQQDRPAAQ